MISFVLVLLLLVLLFLFLLLIMLKLRTIMLKMFDEANQTIGALRFKNNFLAEKTKKLEAELFQVKA